LRLIRNAGLGRTIALNEIGVRRAKGVAATHQRTTIFTERIEINQFIRDQLGKNGVAKYYVAGPSPNGL